MQLHRRVITSTAVCHGRTLQGALGVLTGREGRQGKEGIQEELMLERDGWGRGGKSMCKASKMGGSMGHWRN